MDLEELARVAGAELRPDASKKTAAITRVSSIGQATRETLVFAETAAAFEAACASQAAAVVTHPRLSEGQPEMRKPLLLAVQPKLAFARAARALREQDEEIGGVHSTAQLAEGVLLARGTAVGEYTVIGAGAELGAGTRVQAGCVIGPGVHIGSDCHIYPRVVIYPGVTLGDRVVVHAGAVLGADGFGYVRDAATGEYVQFPQQGTLVIEDDVEIGANVTIDRGALEETRIEHGTKIDNLVHVGHNVRVGRQVVIAAQTGISGSSVIGDGAIVGGQVGIADHVEIGAGVILGAQAGIPSQKKLRGPGVLFWGTPARPIREYLKELAVLSRLAKQQAGKRE